MKLSCDIKGALRTGDRSWVFMALVIILVAFIRFHLLDIPFQRDEGEYAYAGSLLLKGVPPYIQVYNMKLPGMYAAYAVLLAIFGKTYTGVRLGLLFMNAITAVMVFILGKRLVNPLAASLAGALFAVLSLNRYMQGMMANAEHFVIFFAVAGLIVLLLAIDSGRKRQLFLSGLLLGTGFMMKQHGVFFIGFAFVYLAWAFFTKKRMNVSEAGVRGAWFLAGAALPFTATCLALYLAGAFVNFWFWTFTYARQYVSLVTLQDGVRNFKENFPNILISNLPIWGLFAVGLVSPLWDKKLRKHLIFLFGLLLFSFISVTPGLYFREHYFILTLPTVSLLAGMGAAALAGLFSNKKSAARQVIAVSLVVVSFALTIYQDRGIFFFSSPVRISRAMYGGNPFPESIRIAEYIKANSTAQDSIAVLGSEPQIYFYSGRPSATPYIYMYPLMENHRFAAEMQNALIQDISEKRPLFIVYVPITSSWLSDIYSPRIIFNWFNVYSAAHYDRVGVIDIYGDGTDYIWDAEARGREPRSNNSIVVFKRRAGR